MIFARADDQVSVWSGWLVLKGGGCTQKMMQKPPVEVNPQIKGYIYLISGRFKRMFKKSLSDATYMPY